MIKKIPDLSLISSEDSKYMLNEEVLELTLPNNWWDSSDSFSFYGGENINEDVQLFHIGNKLNGNNSLQNELIREPTFDSSKGDHIITNQEYLKKDYTHYRKSKERILKYSIYPALLFAIVLTLSILSFLAKL